MKIGVLGTGYVGLVVALGLADAGHEVSCSDSDELKIRTLKSGKVPFFEPGLEDMLHNHRKRLKICDTMTEVIQSSNILFLCIGTPEHPNGSADLSALFNCAENILKTANEKKTLVIKSTVPPGTAAKLQELAEELCPHPISVVSNPEFLRQGSALEDFLRPDRVVLGVSDPESENKITAIYEPITKSSGAPVISMDHHSAELTKYAANSFLALKISFINELSRLAEKIGANIELVKEGFTKDNRINPSFFNPGIGFGGSCFPKDLRALIHLGETHQVPTRALKAVLEINESQSDFFIEKIRTHLGGFDDKTIGVLGLSFKPKTDDIRRAPAISIIKSLVTSGAKVQAYDPAALPNALKALENRVSPCEDAVSVGRNADAVLIFTEWPEFRALDLIELKAAMRRPFIFDGRNLFEPEKMRALGFHYFSVGR